MNVNQKIESALAEVTENIWPLCCPYDSPPEKYLVYNPEDETAEYYADDEDQNGRIICRCICIQSRTISETERKSGHCFVSQDL